MHGSNSKTFTATVAVLALATVAALAPTAPIHAQTTSAAKPAMLAPEKIVLLVRSALLTLNDAVQTGNFTVLRDKAAPAFRQANTAAKIGKTFDNLSQSQMDLSAVAVIAPQLSAAPVIDANNFLRLSA